MRAQRYLLAGTLTVIPIWITWVVFKFVFGQLSQVGTPWVKAMSAAVEGPAPSAAALLVHPWFQQAVAFFITLIGLYILGWLATRMAGRRILDLFDRLMHSIPMVQTVYGGTKKLLSALQQQPEEVQRVVLIEFPHPGMKTIGLVTRTLVDSASGQLLAAVYVPTTPNPTSGYLEVVPVESLVSTDWTLDEAMSFVISGGAVAPEKVRYYPETHGTKGSAPAPATEPSG